MAWAQACLEIECGVRYTRRFAAGLARRAPDDSLRGSLSSAMWGVVEWRLVVPPNRRTAAFTARHPPSPLALAPKKSSRRRRLIGMGASTPSREATGAEEQQIRPKGAVAIAAGRSVIGMGASTPSRARRDRRWGAAKTICRRKELTEV